MLGTQTATFVHRLFAVIVLRRFATPMFVFSQFDHFVALAYMNKLKFSTQFSLQLSVSATNYRRKQTFVLGDREVFEVLVWIFGLKLKFQRV